MEIFAGTTAEAEDTRRDYGEVRIICFGFLRGRLVQVVYTPRGAVRHIISMRKANAREKARVASWDLISSVSTRMSFGRMNMTRRPS